MPQARKRRALDHQHVASRPQHPRGRLLGRVEVFRLEVGVGHEHKAALFSDFAQVVHVGVPEPARHRGHGLPMRGNRPRPTSTGRQRPFLLAHVRVGQGHPRGVDERRQNGGMAVAKASSKFVVAHVSLGGGERPPGVHGRPAVGIPGLGQTLGAGHDVGARGRRRDPVPLPIKPTFHTPLSDASPHNRGPTPHTHLFKLGDPEILGKAPFDA